MTLYELIARISAILTPETGSFYQYVLHSSDDNGGFLRTRFCLWDRPVPDREIPPLEGALVCFRKPFCEDYGEGTGRVQLQLFYQNQEDNGFYASWSKDMGFGVPYLFDLREKSVRILDVTALED